MNDETQPHTSTSEPAGVLPDHAKVVDRLVRLDDRLGELRRHL
jgi:hypothetical protein